MPQKPMVNRVDPRTAYKDTAQHEFATPATTSVGTDAVLGEDMDARLQQIQMGYFDNMSAGSGGTLPNGQALPSFSSIATSLKRKEMESYGRDPSTGALIRPSTGASYAAATKDEQGNVSDPYFQASKQKYDSYMKRLNDAYMQRQQMMQSQQPNQATLQERLQQKIAERAQGTM